SILSRIISHMYSWVKIHILSRTRPKNEKIAKFFCGFGAVGKFCVYLQKISAHFHEHGYTKQGEEAYSYQFPQSVRRTSGGGQTTISAGIHRGDDAGGQAQRRLFL